MGPAGVEDRLEALRAPSVVRRPTVVRLQGAPVLAPPPGLIADRHLQDLRIVRVGHGDREPLPAFAILDLVPVLEPVLLELNVVERDEDVAPSHLVEEAQVRQVLRLVDRRDHAVDESAAIKAFDTYATSSLVSPTCMGSAR
jgi:hypothetical protein